MFVLVCHFCSLPTHRTPFFVRCRWCWPQEPPEAWDPKPAPTSVSTTSHRRQAQCTQRAVNCQWRLRRLDTHMDGLDPGGITWAVLACLPLPANEATPPPLPHATERGVARSGSRVLKCKPPPRPPPFLPFSVCFVFRLGGVSTFFFFFVCAPVFLGLSGFSGVSAVTGTFVTCPVPLGNIAQPNPAVSGSSPMKPLRHPVVVRQPQAGQPTKVNFSLKFSGFKKKHGDLYTTTPIHDL